MKLEDFIDRIYKSSNRIYRIGQCEKEQRLKVAYQSVSRKYSYSYIELMDEEQFLEELDILEVMFKPYGFDKGGI